SAHALGPAKTRGGSVEAIRVLRLVRMSARRNRHRSLNQMRSIVSPAPDQLREQFRGVTGHQLVKRAAKLRPGGRDDVSTITKLALRTLARRIIVIDEE